MHQTDLTRPGERLDKIANGAATFVPALGLVCVAWQLWGSALHWQDWVLFSDVEANEDRYAPDHLDDRMLRIIDKTFILWVIVGLAFSFGLGVALTGTVVGGLTGLLWGGAVRIFFVHHITFSINSLCHFFGKRTFDTDDESRNLAWLAPLTFGEAWHNNHHAFPTSYRHGLRRWQIDPGAGIIRLLEKSGLAWDVVRIDPARLARRTTAAY